MAHSWPSRKESYPKYSLRHLRMVDVCDSWEVGKAARPFVLLVSFATSLASSATDSSDIFPSSSEQRWCFKDDRVLFSCPEISSSRDAVLASDESSSEVSSGHSSSSSSSTMQVVVVVGSASSSSLLGLLWTISSLSQMDNRVNNCCRFPVD